MENVMGAIGAGAMVQASSRLTIACISVEEEGTQRGSLCLAPLCERLGVGWWGAGYPKR